MTTDKLHLWEKAPIVGLFLAQGLYVWRWYVGDALLPPALVIGAAGLAAVTAIDGAMVATVAGMRAGRRSRASVAAILVTAAFGAAVALDLYGAISGASAWLHAGFALTIVCYLLHLAAPVAGTSAADYQRKAAQAEARVAQLVAEVAQASDRAAQAEALLARAGDDAAQAEQRAAQLDRELAQARRELARRPQEDGAAWLTYNGQRVTLAQLVEATGTPSATLRRRLARVAEQTAQAAD